jgi:hypothetical protein
VRRLTSIVGVVAVAAMSMVTPASAVGLSTLSPIEFASVDLFSQLGLKSGALDSGQSGAPAATDLAAGILDSGSGLSLAAPGLRVPLPSLNAGFADATIALADDLHFRLGAAVGQPTAPTAALTSLDHLELSRMAQDAGVRNGLAGLDWSFASWGTLGLAVSHLEPGYAAIGGPLMLQPREVGATTIAISARLNLGDGWVTSISYNEGRSQLDLRPNGFVADNDARGYGIAIAKYGLFGADSLGLAVVHPVIPAELTGPNGYAGLLGNAATLSDQKPETDLELGYETSFNGNITLEANAGYQMNVGGQSGANGISVLSRAKINF